MRIIAGSRRGKKLLPLRSSKTRPTGGRLRETIFNVIGSAVSDAVVLDLFAGTGALGIEALSRGAGSAVFVDADPAAVDLIHRNCRNCGFSDLATVIRHNILTNLNCLRRIEAEIDLVFVDPPYDRQMVAPALDHLVRAARLHPNALIVVEHGRREELENLCRTLQLREQRRYGKTLVSFLSPMV